MPITVTKTTTLYQFSELDERAKERARDWWRRAFHGDDFWSDGVIEDAATIADLMGIDLRTRPVKLMGGGTRYEPAIYWSGFSSQGDGACFEGSYNYAKGSRAAVRSHAPEDKELHRIVDALASAQRKNFYKLRASIEHRARYSHEFSVTIDVEYDGDRYREVVGDSADEIAEALRDFMRWIYRALEKEYEYQYSAECVDENIQCNEYTFDEDGNREGWAMTWHVDKYEIIRYYMNGRKRRLDSGLTLEEAQAHCNDPETSSRTAVSSAARARTSRNGPWFDGYEKE